MSVLHSLFQVSNGAVLVLYLWLRSYILMEYLL